MTDLNALSQRNAARWSKMQTTRDATEVARRLCAGPAKVRYQQVAQETGVPWFIIAVIHYREADQRWDTQLGQGDPLDKVSIHRPKGRGPFSTWYAGAVDALVNCAPYAARWKDWSAGGALTLLEQYNGLGYAAHGLPSPYLFAGTDQYVKGKYSADGVYDPELVDRQLGCACILKAMMVADTTITFTGATLSPQPAPRPVPQPVPQKPSIWAAIFSAVLSIFKRKS